MFADNDCKTELNQQVAPKLSMVHNWNGNFPQPFDLFQVS